MKISSYPKTKENFCISFIRKIVPVLFILFLTINLSLQGQTVSDNIRLNQVGYYPNLEKKVYVAGGAAAAGFSVQSLDHATTYYTGSLGSTGIADFSAFTTPGKYVINVAGTGYSMPFSIHAEVLNELSVAAIKGYYYKRASTAITSQYGGVYARTAGHPDTQVMIHASAASAARPEGTIVSAPKGWYDAGDYNCYVVNSNITTYTLLSAYEHFQSYYDTLKLNIPETGNSMPDILDEIKWNLDWMLAMQDPSDGGVYDKKTTAAFSEFVMPAADQAQRYMVGKSQGSTFGFAAVMAVAYRVYLPYDAAYANQCLEASKKAYACTASLSYSTNPPGISTGVYNSQSNEKAWAGVELYISTKDDAYYVPNYQLFCQYEPKWYQVNTVGLMSLVHHRKSLTAIGLADTTTIKNKLLSFANANRSNLGFTSLFSGEWGSNSFALNAGMMDMCAYLLTKDKAYLNSAIYIMDYVLGKNGAGYCFVTSFGSKRVMHPHDRISSADGIAEPIPGWVVGGGSSYVDVEERYDLNEVAINWNAPLVFLSGGLQYVNRTDLSPVIKVMNGTETVATNGTLQLGSSIVQTESDKITLTIKNAGGISLQVSAILATTGLHVSAPDPAGLIVPGTSATFTVSATPSNPGLNTGTIKIVTNDLQTPQFLINVSVKGRPDGEPFLEVLNGSDLISSDNEPVLLLGSSEKNVAVDPVTITLSNGGTQPLTISSVTSTAGFVVSSAEPAGDIAVDGSASFTITGTPAHTGINEGIITIKSNDPLHSVFLLNVGVTGLGPVLRIYQNNIPYTNNPAEYIFSPSVVQGNQSTPVEFVMKNEGTAALILDAPVITGPFELVGQIPSSLDANTQATFSVIFKPLTTGTLQGAINFTDGEDQTFTLDLSGTGILATGTSGSLAADAFTISPNPTKQDMYVQINGAFNNVSINVYNTLGELVLSAALNDADNTLVPLTLRNKAAGMYLVEVSTDQGSSVKRIIKE